MDPARTAAPAGNVWERPKEPGSTHQLAPQPRNADPHEPGRGGACRSTAFIAPLSSQGNHQTGRSRLPFLPSFSPLPPLLLTWPHLRAQQCMGPRDRAGLPEQDVQTIPRTGASWSPTFPLPAAGPGGGQAGWKLVGNTAASPTHHPAKVAGLGVCPVPRGQGQGGGHCC